MKSTFFTLATAFLISSLSAQYVAADQAKAKDFSDKAKQKIQTGDVGKAELLYAQALQEEPNSSEIALSLAEFYIQQRRFDEAEKMIARGDVNHFHYWKTKAILYQSTGDQPHAIAAFEQALNVGGKEDTYVLSNLQMHYEASGDSARKKQMENLLASLSLKS
ncbi:MAG: tetratricopeptide repeat protein, partial [Pseudomonadota bacterium]